MFNNIIQSNKIHNPKRKITIEWKEYVELHDVISCSDTIKEYRNPGDIENITILNEYNDCLNIQLENGYIANCMKRSIRGL